MVYSILYAPLGLFEGRDITLTFVFGGCQHMRLSTYKAGSLFLYWLTRGENQGKSFRFVPKRPPATCRGVVSIFFVYAISGVGVCYNGGGWLMGGGGMVGYGNFDWA